MSMSVEDLMGLLAQADAQLGASQGAQTDDYLAAKATFRMTAAPDPKSGAIRNAQGWMLYPNGTIVTDSGILYPNSSHGVDPEDVAGSKEWAEKIQDSWSEEKANEWRKKLWEQGYTGAEGLQSDKGGMAYDLLNALQAYHSNRYANGGRVLPLAPSGAGGGDRIKDVVDPVALREEIKGWGQVPFEEDLDPDTADYFANQVMETARRLMKDKGWDATRAVEGAGVRVQKKFLEDENVAGAIEQAEDDEMDETLRDSIVSIAQLGSV